MSKRLSKKTRKKSLPCSEDKVKSTPGLDELASLEHQQWSHWTSWMLDQIEEEMSDTSPKLAKWFGSKLKCVQRWRRQCQDDYSELSDHEKESDRKEVALKFPGYSAAARGRVPDTLEEKYIAVSDANRASRASRARSSLRRSKGPR